MRSYLDACGITRALDIVGDRWTLPVVRELVFGPRRYSDLATALPGVSTNILSVRLASLVKDGVVRKRRLSPPAASTVYELTRWGASLEPTLLELGRWAAHTPVNMEKQAFSASSLALSLKVTFSPERATDVHAHVRMIMGEETFDARVDGRALTVRKVGQDDVSGHGSERVHLSGSPKALAVLIYEVDDVAEVIDSGLVRVEGPVEALQEFVRSFVSPTPLQDTT